MTKLVEVALPLEEISAASRRDKDRKTGTIKNVHKWFAPMPTPAWRALLFASLVDDPGDEDARHELLEFVKKLVPADGTAPPQEVLDEANRRIRESVGDDLPTVYDPFCGGGSTLVEAQRLGLPAAGSDLNPVPVLITRTLTELIPKVAGRPPLMGDPSQLKGMAGGPLDGFLADCRYYAERVREEVWNEIGHLYPPAPGGGTVIAWLWARTVTCPNPKCHAVAPLVGSFWLSKRRGALAWIEPVPNGIGQPVTFTVVNATSGGPELKGTKRGRGAKFECVNCKAPIPEDHVRTEGQRVGLGRQLMATAVETPEGRVYLDPSRSSEVPTPPRPPEVSTTPQPDYARWFSSPAFGMREFADLFTPRQLVAVDSTARSVAKVLGWAVEDGGDESYATAVATVLALAVGKFAAASSSQSRWKIDSRNGSGKAEAAFGLHALPMVWDFTEVRPFGTSAGAFEGHLESISRGLLVLPQPSRPSIVAQADARAGGAHLPNRFMLATDPPYFSQIGYADLSDFFYPWLRLAAGQVHPELFRTIATPKTPELIAASYRHGGDKDVARRYFIDGFTDTFQALLSNARPDLPMIVVYAHRQEESSDDGVSSTAWDAMLTAILDAGLRIVGTWPLHATTSNRQIGQGTNALASYVVLVCRPQVDEARTVDLPAFRGALRAELPRAIAKLQQGGISAIDLGQACIGPGMEVFSRFAKVIDPVTGTAMSVGSALQIISEVEGEVLDEFAGEMDRPTRWAMVWFKEHGFGTGTFDAAEKIFKQTTTSYDGLQRAGIIQGRADQVALIDQLSPPSQDESSSQRQTVSSWGPDTDRDVTVWEVTNHLAAQLKFGGEQAAADLMARCARWSADARELAYWLSHTASVNGWVNEALDYDSLVTSWTQIDQLAQKSIGAVQPRLVE